MSKSDYRTQFDGYLYIPKKLRYFFKKPLIDGMYFKVTNKPKQKDKI